LANELLGPLEEGCETNRINRREEIRAFKDGITSIEILSAPLKNFDLLK
jgi:hypothetical protein